MKRSQLGDILTKIRNGQNRKKKEICLGQISKLCQDVLTCLVEDGWINYWYFKKSATGNQVWVSLKYFSNKGVFKNLKLISKPRRKVFISTNELRLHLNQSKLSSNQKNIANNYHPFETWILSTSNGILTCKIAFLKKIGGELLCSVY